jgi:hypothetical protein
MPNEARKRYRENNIEHMRAQEQESRDRHSEQRREYARRYRTQHQTAIRAKDAIRKRNARLQKKMATIRSIWALLEG